MAQGSEMFDIAVIGAGIAGASAAAEMSQRASVVLLEMEERPGYHTTGRSAALFSGGLGNAVVGGLSVASGAFLKNPSTGFAAVPLVLPRGVLLVGRTGQRAALDVAMANARRDLDVRRLNGNEARELNPLLRAGYVDGAIWNPDAMDIDVDALHGGYLKLFRANGGQLRVNAGVEALHRIGDAWRLETRAGALCAGIVVNAAGAWADVVAGKAGLPPVGLTPLRRTAMLIDPPAGADIAAIPMTIDVDEQFYLKPDAGKFLVSPADETPMPPQDVQPDELDIAQCIDRIERAFALTVQRVNHKWAGLRTFAPDRVPVAGFDPLAEGFFWLAGQGGFGIQTSPAMARLAAALVTGRDMPADIAAAGVNFDAVSPARFRQRS